MDEVYTPHRGVSIVVRPPGRRMGIAVFALVVSIGFTAFVAARGTGYTYGPAPRSADLTAPALPSEPGASRKLGAKLLADVGFETLESGALATARKTAWVSTGRPARSWERRSPIGP